MSKDLIAKPNQKSPAMKKENQIDHRMVRDLIEVQKADIATRQSESEYRLKELDLKNKEEDHAFEYAKGALDAQASDLKDRRGFIRTLVRWGLVAGVILSFIIVGFFCFALWLDKDQIVLEILKYTFILLGGGGAGYAIGKRRRQTDTDQDEE